MQLDEALAQWRHWGLGREPEILEIFSQGLNHRTAKLSGDAQPLVLKVFNYSGEHEVASQEAAATAGFAPSIIYTDSEFRYAVMQLAVGSSPIPGNVSDREIQAIAGALHQLHRSPVNTVTSARFDLVRFCEDYLGEAGQKAVQLHSNIAPLLDEYAQDTTPWCWCHNDLVAANVFVDGSQAHLIDWEYANLHNPWFDLAAIVLYLKLTREQARTLLKAYELFQPNLVEARIFLVSQVALLWGDMLWHLAKFGEAYWSNLVEKEQQLDDLLRKLTSFRP